MPRAFFDHTGDVGVALRAPTLAALFREAALALTETITEAAAVQPSTELSLSVQAPSLDDLLVEWLSELLYRFEVQNLLTAEAVPTVSETDHGWTVSGRVTFDAFQPDRHPIKVLVKGITYHRLHVRRTAAEWVTDVVFDI